MFAVMIEGLIFMFLSLIDARRFVMKYFPMHLMKSGMAGIGLFLAFIGLQAGNGIDIIRANPAVLIDIVAFDGAYQARTFLGLFFFFLMALLVAMNVRGGIMIAILLSTFFCWILEAGEVTQFVYQPVCCLGTVKFAGDFFPAAGSSWLGTEQFMPKPICEGPAGVFEVTGTGKNVYLDPNDDPFNAKTDKYYVSEWTGGRVTGDYYNWTVTDLDGTVNYVPGKALQYKGNGDGRNSLGFKGDCMDVCHAMFGGFGGVTPGVYGYGPCFGTTLIHAGCWTGMSHRAMGDLDQDTMRAMDKMGTAPAGTPTLGLGEMASSYTVIDGFGEGCLGGAGRIPKTFGAPSGFAAAPKAMPAGDIIAPYPGWFGCSTDANGTETCTSGDVSGGTVAAFDTEGLTMENFGIPLLVLLYVDFIGTLAFLYAAADRLGVIDPANPGMFEGCYAAFWADAVGTFIGGILGTSSVTTYGESMAGIGEGGKTGLTALWIAFFNFLCIFLSPFISSIPTISTGPALIMVGVFMASGLRDIDWYDYMQAIPAIVTILLMPVTYKIEVGICMGAFVYIFMKIFSLRILLDYPGYDKLPGCIQAYITRQPLSASELAKVEGGIAPTKATVSTTVSASISAEA